MRSAEQCFRAARTCDQVLAALAAFPDRDDAIVSLDLAIMDDRLEAVLGARETALQGSVRSRSLLRFG